MYNNRRFGKIRRKNPLVFRNPFRSGYVTNDPKLIVAPIRREGITSIENAERERIQKRFSELGNAGMLKQMKEYGMIPDDFQVDLAKYTGNTGATPQGVASLEQLEKEGDAARQIERMNAGILSEDERRQKLLYEIAQKRKAEQGREKMIQWLSTTDELDEVPIEFQEEVDKYYKEHGFDDTKIAAIQKKREDRKKARMDKEDEKRIQQKYWESRPGWDFVSPEPVTSHRYMDDPSSQSDSNNSTSEMRKLLKEITRNESDATEINHMLYSIPYALEAKKLLNELTSGKYNLGLLTDNERKQINTLKNQIEQHFNWPRSTYHSNDYDAFIAGKRYFNEIRPGKTIDDTLNKLLDNPAFLRTTENRLQRIRREKAEKAAIEAKKDIETRKSKLNEQIEQLEKISNKDEAQLQKLVKLRKDLIDLEERDLDFSGHGAISKDARNRVIQFLAYSDDIPEDPEDLKDEIERYRKSKGIDSSKLKKRREAKYGIIRRRYDIPNTEGSGWRAPRLHNLVRPLKKFNMGETPEQIVGEQKDALDERRSKFKDQAMFQRGVYPSKDEIESAFPKTVEPFIPDPRNIPKTGIILHPFIFPSKKYMVKTGVF